jgi:hypothetical protein
MLAELIQINMQRSSPDILSRQMEGDRYVDL